MPVEFWALYKKYLHPLLNYHSVLLTQEILLKGLFGGSDYRTPHQTLQIIHDAEGGGVIQ